MRVLVCGVVGGRGWHAYPKKNATGQMIHHPPFLGLLLAD